MKLLVIEILVIRGTTVFVKYSHCDVWYHMELYSDRKTCMK